MSVCLVFEMKQMTAYLHDCVLSEIVYNFTQREFKIGTTYDDVKIEKSDIIILKYLFCYENFDIRDRCENVLTLHTNCVTMKNGKKEENVNYIFLLIKFREYIKEIYAFENEQKLNQIIDIFATYFINKIQLK